MSSACHREAVEMLITIPTTTGNLGAMLSKESAIQRKNSSAAILEIFSSVRLLCRQGLPLRYDKAEIDSNLHQLLQEKAQTNTNFAQWLKRKENVHTSADIQNEMIKVMGINILCKISTDIHASPFISVMADETADASNVEQVSVFIRYISNELEVHEDFLGLYSVPSIDAAMLVSVIKDVFLRMNISFDKLRGQCYDGASAMSGSKKGVAKCISDIEPRAVYTHCYGHALNLAASDTIKKSKIVKDALDLTQEITKLIKYSPRREGVFKSIKEACLDDTSGIRVLCPTRWIVRADALASITSNFKALMLTWEETAKIVKDTDTKCRIYGVSKLMNSYIW